MASITATAVMFTMSRTELSKSVKWITKAERIDGMTIVMLVISAALVFIPVYKSMKKNKYDANYL